MEVYKNWKDLLCWWLFYMTLSITQYSAWAFIAFYADCMEIVWRTLGMYKHWQMGNWHLLAGIITVLCSCSFFSAGLLWYLHWITVMPCVLPSHPACEIWVTCDDIIDYQQTSIPPITALYGCLVLLALFQMCTTSGSSVHNWYIKIRLRSLVATTFKTCNFFADIQN